MNQKKMCVKPRFIAICLAGLLPLVMLAGLDVAISHGSSYRRVIEHFPLLIFALLFISLFLHLSTNICIDSRAIYISHFGHVKKRIEYTEVERIYMSKRFNIAFLIIESRDDRLVLFTPMYPACRIYIYISIHCKEKTQSIATSSEGP